MYQILTGVVLSGVTLLSMANVGLESYSKQLDQIATAQFERERQCLAENIYHEARSESEVGKRAVAYVTLNRTHDPNYPDDVCDVVHQGKLDSKGNPVLNQCQFSWYCDGKSDKIDEPAEWLQSQIIAGIVLATYGNSFDPTEGAVMYHAESVKPSWRKAFERTAQIDNHIFYKKVN